MSPELVDVMPVLRAACALAMRDGHPHIGSEHVARLAVPGPGGLLEMAARAGIACDATSLDHALATCCPGTDGAADRATEPRITPRTARMASMAAQLALVDGSGTVAPRHLVAALLGEPGAVAWRGLAMIGLPHARACVVVASASDATLRPTA